MQWYVVGRKFFSSFISTTYIFFSPPRKATTCIAKDVRANFVSQTEMLHNPIRSLTGISRWCTFQQLEEARLRLYARRFFRLLKENVLLFLSSVFSSSQYRNLSNLKRFIVSCGIQRSFDKFHGRQQTLRTCSQSVHDSP